MSQKHPALPDGGTDYALARPGMPAMQPDGQIYWGGIEAAMLINSDSDVYEIQKILPQAVNSLVQQGGVHGHGIEQASYSVKDATFCDPPDDPCIICCCWALVCFPCCCLPCILTANRKRISMEFTVK